MSRLGVSYLGELYLGSDGMRIPSGLTGPALSDVILAKHGDRGRVPLELGGIRASWEVNQPGEFSAFARLDDVRSLVTYLADLRGWWLMWEHPYLGHWGGVITDLVLSARGTVEIAARGWLALLDKRLTRRRDTSVIAHAGPIAARLVRDAGAVAPTGIVSTDAEEYGEFVDWRDDGGEVLSALSRLSFMSDQDFSVGEHDRIFYWRRRFGTNKTGSVQLVQGTHIADWRPSYALGPVVNEVVLSPNDSQRFAKSPSIAGHDSASYAAFGPRQQRGTYRGAMARPAVQSIARKQAERFARRGHLIELDIVNASDCFDWFRKGDTITAVIADLDQALQVRILLMSWDQDSDLVRVSGEIV
jgi:hypothetical protein